jgi:hypothetical protein
VKKTTLLAIAFVLLVLCFIMISSFDRPGVSCRVCITFKGASDCRRATAATRQEALRAAVTTACAQLSGGVIESSQCENTTPTSIEWK